MSSIMKARGIRADDRETIVHGQVLIDTESGRAYIIASIRFIENDWDDIESFEIIPETLGYATGWKNSLNTEDLYSGDEVVWDNDDGELQKGTIKYSTSLEDDAGVREANTQVMSGLYLDWERSLTDSEAKDLEHIFADDSGYYVINSIHQNKELLEEE